MRAPQRKRGLGCGWIGTLVAVAAVSLIMWFVSPYIGVSGIVLLIILYVMASRIEGLEEQVADLATEREDDRDDLEIDSSPSEPAPRRRVAVEKDEDEDGEEKDDEEEDQSEEEEAEKLRAWVRGREKRTRAAERDRQVEERVANHRKRYQWKGPKKE